MYLGGFRAEGLLGCHCVLGVVACLLGGCRGLGLTGHGLCVFLGAWGILGVEGQVEGAQLAEHTLLPANENPEP